MTAKRLPCPTKIRSARRLRPVSALLAALLMLTGIPGCRREEAYIPPEAGPRFEGTVLPMPGELFSIQSAVYRDEEAGTLTCLASHMDVESLPDGGFGQKMRWSLVTSEPGGEAVLREEVLPLDPLASVFKAVIGRDEAFFLLTHLRNDAVREAPQDIFLGRYDRNTGELTLSDNIAQLFPSDGFWTETLCADRDGILYVGAGREVLVFAPDFRILRSVPVPGDVGALGLNDDGEPMACADWIANDRLYRAVYSLDPEKGEASERFRMPSWDGCGNAVFAPGRDLYLMDRAGIWGVVSKEHGGTGEAEMIMDFAASDVIPESTSLCGILDADRIVLTERNMDGEQNWIPSLSLYTRAEDADLTGVTVLTLAYDLEDRLLTSRIAAFNKSQRDIRVTPLDYVGDEGRLALDMTAGLIRPDIVVTLPDGECARQLYKKKLFADLTPYLDRDELVNRDNLFGAVIRAFDDGNGGIWGLSTGLTLTTLAARRDMLPENAAEEGCWTLSELTDFAAALPEGVDFLRPPCREVFEIILEASDGLGEFIDREAGTCSFDGPEFRRVLDYLLSLPGYEGLTAAGYMADEEDFAPYLEGRIALRDAVIRSPGEILGLSTLFGTEDFVLIGLPTPIRRSGAGIRADMNDAVALTSFCEHPDAAWAMIRFLFEGEVPMTVSVNGALRDPIPSLRSRLESMIDAYTAGDMEFRFYYDGASSMKHGDRAHPTDPAELDRPGVVSFFTEEAKDELEAVLDRAGSPMAEAVDPQIREIVREELSALYAGACSPEDCAARIRSRVSLWLAENR